jgi:hypothetical protein
MLERGSQTTRLEMDLRWRHGGCDSPLGMDLQWWRARPPPRLRGPAVVEWTPSSPPASPAPPPPLPATARPGSALVCSGGGRPSYSPAAVWLLFLSYMVVRSVALPLRCGGVEHDVADTPAPWESPEADHSTLESPISSRPCPKLLITCDFASVSCPPLDGEWNEMRGVKIVTSHGEATGSQSHETWHSWHMSPSGWVVVLAYHCSGHSDIFKTISQVNRFFVIFYCFGKESFMWGVLLTLMCTFILLSTHFSSYYVLYVLSLQQSVFLLGVFSLALLI